MDKALVYGTRDSGFDPQPSRSIQRSFFRNKFIPAKYVMSKGTIKKMCNGSYQATKLKERTENPIKQRGINSRVCGRGREEVSLENTNIGSYR
jgi:hypothetical protein